MYTTDVFFNGYNLNDLDGVYVYNYDVINLPARNLTISKLARADRSLLTSAEYASKDIAIFGYVGGSTADIIQSNFDRLKALVQEPESVVRVNQGGVQVEYTGTLNGITKEYTGPSLGFSLQFRCSDPIGRSTTLDTLLSSTSITTSSFSQILSIGGSSTAFPRFTIVFDSVTDGTNKAVTLTDAVTGNGIQITRTWTNGDILSIYSDTFEALVNGSPIDFAGQFPKFPPGMRTLQYTDELTARTASISATYVKRYI